MPPRRAGVLELRSKRTVAEGPPVANARVTVESLLNAALSTDFKNENEKAITKFRTDFLSRLSNPANNESKEKQALHELATYTNKMVLSKYEPFLRWVCQEYPDLLKCKYLAHPPIHIAIMEKNAEFIRIVLESALDSETLFGPADDKNRTCLHFAIEEKSVLTQAIIERAKELRKTGAKDDSNVFMKKTYQTEQTPLHCAVAQEPDGEEYDTQDPEVPYQTQTTTATPTMVPDPIMYDTQVAEGQVPHLETIPGLAPSGAEVPQSPVKTNGFPRTGPDSFPDEAPVNPLAALKAAREKFVRETKALKGPTRSMSFKPTPDGATGHQFIPHYRVGETIKSLIDAMDGALLEQDSYKNTPYQAIVKELDESLEEAIETGYKRKVRREEEPGIYEMELRIGLNSDPRAKIIRNYCVEKLSRKDALKALYKVGEECVIEFDLSQMLYSPIDADFLKGLEKVLHFENILSYVALPRLSVRDDKEMQSYLESMDDASSDITQDPKLSLSGNEITKDVVQQNKDENSKAKDRSADEKEKSDKEGTGTKGKGLTSLCPIFRWLRNLDVSAIIKITVIDDVEPSHSDAAIEACLEGFDIETWNWKKFDICSEVIFKAAPKVKEVILYSSGNNAVLLGWSSSAGLNKLRELKSVSIIVREGLESPTRLKQYMWDFEQAIKFHKNLKNIKFGWKPDDPKNSYASTFIDKAIIPEDNLWLLYMKKFAEFMKNAKTDAEPVKIAVIDDGINTALNVFTKRIHSGDSFYDPTLESFHGRRGVYYVPSGRHGTLMAQLICDICPTVKLFVAQLQATPGKEQQRSFTTQSAIDAVLWAIDRKVDIISMSWSIDASHDTDRLNNALHKAHSAGILMFCSCIDRGASVSDDTYPGRSTYCFKIGASTASGEKLPWVSGTKSEYLLPGENVQPAEEDAWSQFQSGPFGSSIATALAAGLAGVLLYCDRLIECQTKALTPTGESEIEYLRDKTNMKTVFDSMVSRDRFIEVRNSLEVMWPDPQEKIWNSKKKDTEKMKKMKQDLQNWMWNRKGKPVA